MKDTDFYNQESASYSQKRYPKVAQSYTQYFFNRRLALTKAFLRKALEPGKTYSLLELGCADGIVVRELAKDFPNAFSKLIGVDISPGMINEARRHNSLSNASFVLRSEYAGKPVDIVNETGVINYAGFDTDIAFAHDNLKEKGCYILSVAGIGSIRNRLKPEAGFADFRSYKEYEALLRPKFEVLAVAGCGVFVPLIWKLPSLARLVHTVLEPFMGALMPSLCHEKLYLLKKK